MCPNFIKFDQKTDEILTFSVFVNTACSVQGKNEKWAYLGNHLSNRKILAVPFFHVCASAVKILLNLADPHAPPHGAFCRFLGVIALKTAMNFNKHLFAYHLKQSGIKT